MPSLYFSNAFVVRLLGSDVETPERPPSDVYERRVLLVFPTDESGVSVVFLPSGGQGISGSWLGFAGAGGGAGYMKEMRETCRS